MKNTKRLLAILLIVCSLLALSACGAKTENADETTTAETTVPETEGLIYDPVAENINDLSVQTEIGFSHLVVEGEITAVSEPFTVTSTKDGNKRNFYEYDVKVTDAIAGSVNNGDTIKLRMPGGLVGNVKTVNSASPKLSIGSKYILMLNKAVLGSGYYVTEDTYYTIVGVNQGCYPLTEDGSGIKEMPYNQSEFKDLVTKYFNVDEIDYENQVKQMQNQLSENYSDGLITKEDFDKSVAALKLYATKAN